MNNKKPQLIMLMGFITSGKDTQAKILNERKRFSRIRTSKIIRNKFMTYPDNPDVILAKKQYYKGDLIEPKIVAEWVLDATNEKHKSGNSIVFSGSPRTLYEAKNELPEFIKLYGKENIKLFFIDITEQEARKRTNERLVCDKCMEVIRPDKYPDAKIEDECPTNGCKGKIIKRTLDDSEIFEVRLKEYYNKTYPVIEYLKNKVKFYKVNGMNDIESIHKEISKNL